MGRTTAITVQSNRLFWKRKRLQAAFGGYFERLEHHLLRLVTKYKVNPSKKDFLDLKDGFLTQKICSSDTLSIPCPQRQIFHLFKTEKIDTGHLCPVGGPKCPLKKFSSFMFSQ
jgi:hypothetical protein